MVSSTRRFVTRMKQKPGTSLFEPQRGSRSFRGRAAWTGLFACCVLMGTSEFGAKAHASCGTYVLVAGQPVVHEILQYQTPWRVLNEPQMKQLLTQRWSVDYPVFPPCDDCRCDGKSTPEPLLPTTASSYRDTQPAPVPAGSRVPPRPDQDQRIRTGARRTPLSGFPSGIDRPPDRHLVVLG